jgi:MoaA/NifB/PqqE/SkfB family radical SAM enzyme
MVQNKGMAGALTSAWPKLHGALNFRLMSLAGGRLAHLCRPVSIAFLLTERCNARCVHCDIWKNKGREASPSVDEWKRLLSDLRRWLGPVAIVFTGGEALLYAHALEIVRHATSLGFQVEVLTHGYWNDQTKIRELAMANPSRITTSLDGMGATHSKIRGRDDFFEKTNQTIETLRQMRAEHKLTFQIRLKTVVMEHNLDDLADIARFATRDRTEVFYQPIEQNYNTPLDPLWFQTSSNWPKDPMKAVRRVEELIELKRSGLHIANSDAQLETMLGYFQNPAGLSLATRAHTAHVPKVPCWGLTTLQLQSNGDVTVCENRPPVGNIRTTPIREIWKQRPQAWAQGCCQWAGAAEPQPLVHLPAAAGNGPATTDPERPSGD